ncbi:antibiotic biosynthesis monooxygenase [Meridianimarinicoccus sp. MJW13]|uniref:antibiotic biosynthesis monooxygenase family protein n=1 Tax=Meridianimarinicoccus sp. MJW13 TaxID=2720031 RepID=UPI001868285F|nr:antibiotic biosynthesis monooxygenase family protein [Fluviibacterium sp. MJW13]
MIIRIFRAGIAPDRAAEFETFLRETALPLVRDQDGCLSVHGGVPLEGAETTEFCVVMVWRDEDALRAFAGDDWHQPHILPEEEGLVLTRALHHYRSTDSVLL